MAECYLRMLLLWSDSLVVASREMELQIGESLYKAVGGGGGVWLGIMLFEGV